MRLESLHVRNFRLMRRVSIDLATNATATVLVGPNNSGKTSVMDALRLFVGTSSDAPKISLHDLSRDRHRDLARIDALLAATQDEEQKIALLRRLAPRMRLDLVLRYDEEPADLVAATDLLMNLSPSENIVRLRIEYGLQDAKVLLAEFDARPRKTDNLLTFLKATYKRHFTRSFFKVSPDGREVEVLTDGAIAKRILKIDVVPAQRHVDDDENERAAKLSRLLHEHYTKFYKVDDADGYQAIEDALTDSASTLTDKYETAFQRLTTRLKGFGYPQGQTTPDLRIRAEMSSETIYRDNARIYYASDYKNRQNVTEKFELPERYNGLGYKNLIYIVLQLEAFRAALEAQEDDRPRVHIIAIEEPEAHLHPQMQWVFISEISKVLETDGGTTAQVILSTHSSHIIGNSGFQPIRYFRRSGGEVQVRDLSKIPLSKEPGGVLDFLHRYIKLTHCDLFFADKAIFVEGQVERLLLPLMIENCSATEGCEGFASQYVTISEIGGAYAQKLKPLIDFLGVPTLIITDLDSVGNDNKKCKVADGEKTSNACLHSWLPGKKSLSDLAACVKANKMQGTIRVAYQTVEQGRCGRSFEEAFLYANLDWLKTNSNKLSATENLFTPHLNALADGAWDISTKLPKVDFALDLLATPGWKSPAYIDEGLIWLAQEKSGYDRS